MSELKPVFTLRVTSIADIARFAATMLTLGQPVYLLHFKHNNKHYYGILAIFHDYFNLNGVPIFYYYEGEEEGKYVLVKLDETGEHVVFSDRTRTGWLSIPIVSLYEKPDFIKL
jgi:hypothetical protein